MIDIKININDRDVEYNSMYINKSLYGSKSMLKVVCFDLDINIGDDIIIYFDNKIIFKSVIEKILREFLSNKKRLSFTSRIDCLKIDDQFNNYVKFQSQDISFILNNYITLENVKEDNKLSSQDTIINNIGETYINFCKNIASKYSLYLYPLSIGFELAKKNINGDIFHKLEDKYIESLKIFESISDNYKKVNVYSNDMLINDFLDVDKNVSIENDQSIRNNNDLCFFEGLDFDNLTDYANYKKSNLNALNNHIVIIYFNIFFINVNSVVEYQDKKYIVNNVNYMLEYNNLKMELVLENAR